MSRTITVSSAADAGAGSLRDALAQNAADGGGDTVVFAPGLAGQTIALQSTLGIGQSVTIDGQAGNVAVSGNNAVTVFAVTGGAVAIDNLTIADGRGSGRAGANGGPGGAAAGGVFVQGGSVSLTGDSFSRDTATGGAGAYGPGTSAGGPGGAAAGGVFVQGGSVSLANDGFYNTSATGGYGGEGGSGIGVNRLPYVGPGGAGGNAAGAVYVAPGATASGASGLSSSGTTATGGTGGYGGPTAPPGPSGATGAAYPVSNDAAVARGTTEGAVALTVLDTTSGQRQATAGAAYSGPVAGLQRQYIYAGPDNLNVAAGVPNVFIHTGGGNDAIDVSAAGGTNVLDGGTGSNFLVGGKGAGSQDTFFVDDRDASADIWSTVAGFHGGDAATVFGVTPQDYALQWVDGQGAAGYTGLTLHATAAGKATASITLTGYSTADLSNGRLTTSFGTVDGNTYLYVRGTG